MENIYDDGKIYMLFCNTTGKRYIGSTAHSIKTRMNHHTNSYKKFKENKHTHLAIFEVLENDNYVVQLIEKYSCKNRDELCEREKFWINTLMCINVWGKNINSKYNQNKEHKERVKATNKINYEKKKQQQKQLELNNL